jgi:hypothetical protein
MNISKTTRIFLLLLLSFQASATYSAGEESVPPKEITIHQKIYNFQHRLLPRWTHQSGGAFFNDLVQDRPEILLMAATEMVGEEFARNISIKKYKDPEAVLLTFPPPKESPACYFIYIAKTKDGFEFYTYEKTVDLFKKGDKGVVGEWSANKGHLNFGPRKYEDAESFVQERRQVK